MAGPQTLGRYQIERVLGKGAMGVVYGALDPKLHRKVAIKTILVSQLDEETAKDFSMRFVREAHAVARLNHPNIVQVYDFGEEGGVAYLVMEFIQGNELKSTLATNPGFDRQESVRIMCELLDALEFAHEQGVIHRDIKPANVMLDTQGRVKLTDFGVARVTDADRTNAERTQAGTMVGTPAYMSPEQIQGQRVDGRSDIFSAGIILYQFLTGQKPFTGDGAWTVAKKIVQDDPPIPSSLNVAVSPQLDRVVAKALAKHPEDRFPTAREFAGALRDAAAGKGTLEALEPTLIVSPKSETPQALRSGEMELEFWRSIKDSGDANDFELYVRQFPQGVYASLAARRIAKLRGLPGAEDSNTRPMSETGSAKFDATSSRAGTEAGIGREPVEQSRPDRTVKLPAVPAPIPQRESAAKPVAEEKTKSRLIPAIFGLIALAGVAAYFVMKPAPQPAPAPQAVDIGEKARREAAEKAGVEAEAQAKREAAARAQQEAEAKAQRDAELRARREAEAQARSEADTRARAQQEAAAARAKGKKEAEAKSQRQAEAKKKQEDEARVNAAREAQAREKRDAEARARREAEDRKKNEAEARAQRDADAKAKLAAESSQWDSVKNSKSAAEVQKYLDRYPNGKYSGPARKRLAALEKVRVDEEKRVAAEKARAEKQKRAEEERAKAQAQEAELAKKREAEPRRPVIVPPSF